VGKTPLEWLALTSIGFAVGVFSGFFGIGGGIIMVPALALVFRMDMAAATGTSLAAMVLAAIAGSIKSASLGHVQWELAGAIGVCAMLGTYLVGVPLIDFMQKHCSQEALQRLFGILLLIVSLRMMGVFSWVWQRVGH
jgi:uncharacterized membrane protein YfcA